MFMKKAQNVCMVGAVLLIGLAPRAALAGEEVVDGVFKVFSPSDVLDNLTVKNGGHAAIDGTTIRGNLTVEGQGSFAQVKSATIGKNVNVLDSGWVNLEETTIGGSLVGDACYHINMWIVRIARNVHLTGCTGLASFFVYVSGNVKIEQGGAFHLHGWDIAGNASATGNQSSQHVSTGFVAGCYIGGNLEVTGNQVVNLAISRATIGKNLMVKNNTPKALVINGTTAGGNMDVE